MKTKTTFWGGLFILAGVLLLLDNLGFLHVNIWALVWPTFIIAMGVWTLMAAKQNTDVLGTEEIIIPLEETKQGKMALSFGAGQLQIHARLGEGKLFGGTFAGGVETKIQHEANFTTLELNPTSIDFLSSVMPWTWGAREWNFGLSPQVAWQLDLEMGASDAQIDLSELQVTNLNIDTGASNTKVILPAKAGQTHVDLDGGAASILFEIPEGVAAKIQVDSGLAAIEINRARFPRVGEFYQSADYETAANKVEITANVGAGSLRIQ
jgi:hypothetical protein